MTQFTRHSIETAPTNSQPIIEGIKKTMGFLPNLLATMAESPAMLESYMTLARIFDKTNLSETERQIILMTNNRLNGCIYCMAAHTTISQMKGVPEGVVTALRENTPIADARLEALRVFAEVINTSRGWPEESDIQAFLAAGYSEEHVLDVILGTSLKVLSNYTNHVAATPLDEAFAKNEWSAPQAIA